jgi:hypothetical protein
MLCCAVQLTVHVGVPEGPSDLNSSSSSNLLATSDKQLQQQQLAAQVEVVKQVFK